MPNNNINFCGLCGLTPCSHTQSVSKEKYELNQHGCGMKHEAGSDCPSPIAEPEGWAKDIDFNSHDMGEMGKFIRVEYAKNIIAETLSRHNLALVEAVKKIVEEETPKHITREYNETDAMRDRILKRLSALDAVIEIIKPKV